MAVVSKPRSGSQSATIRAPELRPLAKGFRGPRPASESYEELRIREITAKTLIHELRIGRLKGDLLNRELVQIESEGVFSAIRGIIQASRLEH